MYIKQVIIEGFKSYKDQIIAEPFSPHINCIVGANGSGKSNFFHAIRFVLNDIFTTMRAEERKTLLHEGAGHAVVSAYVEVVFDNSDGRFPVDRDEVRLRRSIGLKKDEYQLDKKHITKSEVMNLLESAGFSRANPYYVVQQGKIMEMSCMTDHQRLELLKEIGGTKVYEERRKESLKMMTDTESRRAQIEEVVQYIEEKLSELDAEREELAQYQQLDKQRRSIEYSIFDHELTETRQKLEKVDQDRERVSVEASSAKEQMDQARSELEDVQHRLKDTKQSLDDLNKRKKDMRKEKDEAVTKKARLELDVRELEDRLTTAMHGKDQAGLELDDIRAQEEKAQEEVSTVQQELRAAESHEKELRERLRAKEERQKVLFQKQGQTTQFSNQSERDQHIQRQVREVEELRDKTLDNKRVMEQLVQEMNSDLMSRAQDLGDKEAAIRAQDERIVQVGKDLASRRSAKETLQLQRRETQQKLVEVEEKLRHLEDQRTQSNKALERTMAFDISKGLMGMRRVIKEHKIEGVHGTLIDLIDCVPQLTVAAEVTAGNSLFHVVVENDDVATKIVHYLNKDKLGRVTFLPLNTLNVREQKYPTSFGDKAVPLIKHIKFDQHYKKAVQQVFAKTLVCQDLDVAKQVRDDGRFDAITMDGDRINKRNVLSGGYHDTSRLKMELRRVSRSFTEQIDELTVVRGQLRDQDLELERNINHLHQEMQMLEQKKRQETDILTQLRGELRGKKQEEQQLRLQAEENEKQVGNYEEQVAALNQKLNTLRDELGSAFTSTLTAAERRELSKLSPEIKELKDQLVPARAATADVRSRLQSLTQLLTDNLTRRRLDLESQLSEGGFDMGEVEMRLEAARQDLDTAARDLQDTTADLINLEKQVDELGKQAKELQSVQEKLLDVTRDQEEVVANESRQVETLMQKKLALQQRRDDLAKKIKDLGSLPAEAFESYRRKSVKELHKLLSKVQKDLGKYGSVNKKALDQYVNFTEQREALRLRQEDVNQGEEKIKELISALDMRKDEAIERTFKGVSKNFREVFSELVPGGRGELVMLKRHGGQPAAAEEQEEEEADVLRGKEANGTLGKYSGVKVKVSFGGGETMAMKQLSGGQKTLVALALIFAIQRCDPAPFYLFDEIDAALDPQYRTTVAQLLRKQADDPRNPAQFVVTTFQPQIILVCDKIYGVTHKNKISQVLVITKEDALAFLQSEDEQREAAER